MCENCDIFIAKVAAFSVVLNLLMHNIVSLYGCSIKFSFTLHKFPLGFGQLEFSVTPHTSTPRSAIKYSKRICTGMLAQTHANCITLVTGRVHAEGVKQQFGVCPSSYLSDLSLTQL